MIAPFKRPAGLVNAYNAGRGFDYYMGRPVASERIGTPTDEERRAYSRGLRDTAAVREHQLRRANDARLIHRLLDICDTNKGMDGGIRQAVRS